MNSTLLVGLLILALQAAILLLLRSRRSGPAAPDNGPALLDLLGRSDRSLKEDLALGRREQQENTAQLRQGIEGQMHLGRQESRDEYRRLGERLTATLDRAREASEAALNQYRERLTEVFGQFDKKQELHQAMVREQLEGLRQKLERSLSSMQESNEKKLEEMRRTVDEKLHETLEKRLGESFQQVSERLEAVHKGLGEMHHLALNVGDLKKVMTNVKTRGVLGEYQLQRIIEDLLTKEQYQQNVKTKPGSGFMVEFAIRMPHSGDAHKSLWLPVDSKFPKEDYEQLVDAYEQGDAERIEQIRKSFVRAIRKSAQDIREKYIEPPHTTEYGILFLPYESLYGEVLRTPGLFEQLQRDYKITIAGPTTLSALLNSLQMGFRSLAIEQRSSEVWDLLGAVKNEFGQFGDVLAKAKKKLQEAANTIDSSEVRTRAIERKLRGVQTLQSGEEAPEIE